MFVVNCAYSSALTAKVACAQISYLIKLKTVCTHLNQADLPKKATFAKVQNFLKVCQKHALKVHVFI